MTFIQRLGILISILFLSINLSVKESYALSCIEPGNPLEELKKSDVVFKGKVIEQKKDTYIFEVTQVFKGDINESKITGYDSVGFWLAEKVQEGNEYLVYANQDKSKILISPCGATKLWSQGQNDVKEFKVEPRKISPNTVTDSPNHPLQSAKYWILSLDILIIVIAGVLFIKKRNRNNK